MKSPGRAPRGTNVQDAGAGGSRDVKERRSLKIEIVPAGGTSAANWL